MHRNKVPERAEMVCVGRGRCEYDQNAGALQRTREELLSRGIFLQPPFWAQLTGDSLKRGHERSPFYRAGCLLLVLSAFRGCCCGLTRGLIQGMLPTCCSSLQCCEGQNSSESQKQRTGKVHGSMLNPQRQICLLQRQIIDCRSWFSFFYTHILAAKDCHSIVGRAKHAV